MVGVNPCVRLSIGFRADFPDRDRVLETGGRGRSQWVEPGNSVICSRTVSQPTAAGVRVDDAIDSPGSTPAARSRSRKSVRRLFQSGYGGPSLPVPDTRINDDHPASDHDQERLHQSSEPTHLVDEIGCQPCRPGDCSRIELGNEALKRAVASTSPMRKTVASPTCQRRSSMSPLSHGPAQPVDLIMVAV